MHSAGKILRLIQTNNNQTRLFDCFLLHRINKLCFINFLGRINKQPKLPVRTEIHPETFPGSRICEQTNFLHEQSPDFGMEYMKNSNFTVSCDVS
jgi:hypothetical protein